MQTNSKRLILHEINESYITETYVNWLNDPDINMYLESRHITHTLESVRAFINNIVISSNAKMYALIDVESNKHIGNIKLGNIDYINKRSEVGLIIGDRNFWGKGYATEAIKAIVSYAFDELCLNKINAGMYVGNIGSYKAFLRAGFKLDCIQREHFCRNGVFEDSYLMSILKNKL